ncbi:MAG: hypothetical protein Hyperionvirus21_3 [Hyperionvirus sp.]|uniref:J domain-containing protein n=1 Tax=Hyperionvirus sp. TaxID=2487770 RepID=A0A3G5AFV8_9VIRU|nr:MAG: hypothetical protein Hyperionvirus21_3 [Hyperionvirus sp.]
MYVNDQRMLGLDDNVSKEDIRKRYKEIALIIHPDKNNGSLIAENLFKIVTLSYHRLIEDKSIKKYCFECTHKLTQYNNLSTEYANLQKKYDCLIKQTQIDMHQKNKLINELNSELNLLKSSPTTHSTESLIKFFEIFKNDISKKKLIEYYESNINATNATNLGIIYEHIKDIPKAIEWLTLGVELKNNDAPYLLGNIYYSCGNTIKAIELYKQASEYKNEDAMIKLGIIHEDLGQRHLAVKWHKKAAELGNQKALNELQVLLENNFGWNNKCSDDMMYWVEKIPINKISNALGRLVNICIHTEDPEKGRKYFNDLLQIWKSPNDHINIYDEIMEFFDNEKTTIDFLGLALFNDAMNLIKKYADDGRLDAIKTMIAINDDMFQKNYWIQKTKDIGNMAIIKKNGSQLSKIGQMFYDIDDLINAKYYYSEAYRMGELKVSAAIGTLNFDLGCGGKYKRSFIKSKDFIFEAINWYNKALILGDFCVNLELGEIYELLNNISEAIKYYSAAYYQCHKISKDAAIKLGSIYQDIYDCTPEQFFKKEEDIVSKIKIFDLDFAINWYLEAAKLNDIDAIAQLGVCYSKESRFDIAIKWCNKGLIELAVRYDSWFDEKKNAQRELYDIIGDIFANIKWNKCDNIIASEFYAAAWKIASEVSYCLKGDYIMKLEQLLQKPVDMKYLNDLYENFKIRKMYPDYNVYSD